LTGFSDGKEGMKLFVLDSGREGGSLTQSADSGGGLLVVLIFKRCGAGVPLDQVSLGSPLTEAMEK
jgi:hypothetical protein